MATVELFRRIQPAGVPVSAWACLKGIAKGPAETAGFRKTPAKRDRRNALVKQTGVGQIAAATCEAPLPNVLTDRAARALPKDLLEMPAGDSDGRRDLLNG